MITRIESTQPRNRLELRWALNNVCNFKCRYCFPGSNEGNYPSPTDVDLLIKNFNYMLDYYSKYAGKEVFDLKILGGEPTMYKDLDKFIRGIKKEHNVYVSVVSNGSRTIRWWKENGMLIDNLILSYHQQFADLDHTINVADIIHAYGKKVTVHVLMDDQHWDECVASVNYIKANSKYCWMIQTKELVSTSRVNISYTDKQRNFFKYELKRFPSIIWILKNLHLLFKGHVKLFESKYTVNGKKRRATSQYYITTQENNFKGWECAIGVESVYIDFDGELKGSCGQLIFNNTRYNILDKQFISIFNPQLSPSICTINRCVCPPETHLSKSNLSQRNVGSTRTIIPITDNRIYRNSKVSLVDIT
jgi:organic radical activating enzyme